MSNQSGDTSSQNRDLKIHISCYAIRIISSTVNTHVILQANKPRVYIWQWRREGEAFCTQDIGGGCTGNYFVSLGGDLSPWEGGICKFMDC